ncbi:peptide-methionine (R)-S-oxide reductase MsrB [Planctomicrobium sp. SH661]|uniref:peptide-methionine (R)-S-oxide reductase MsrB n=1 Tax=Planctomicrobium sp. SH661 TaxID=3448124 RepID=UPI003F5C0E9C
MPTFFEVSRVSSNCLGRSLMVPLAVCLCLSACSQPSPSQSDPAVENQESQPVSTTEEIVMESGSTPPAAGKLQLSENEWKLRLTPEQYWVLREKGTERPWINEFDEHFEPGTYSCAACGTELFDAETKFNSGCGWPAFYAAKAGDKVTLVSDRSHGMVRTEVLCSHCDSHLGHIFDDAPQTPTGQRFCINSVSLKFTPAPAAPASPPE